VTIDALRRYAVARTLFGPVAIGQAIERFGFVQADPIRAPARAQDLTLRQRVDGYRAGDLEAAYPALAVEEDFFVNYGFVSRDVHALMHPRVDPDGWTPARRRRAQELLAFIAERGQAHPRDVDAHFAHGRVTNYWGGSSSATTHLLEHMHYRGLLRVARREKGIRIYAPALAERVELPISPSARIDALIDVAVHKYAPLPRATLSWLVNRLRYAVPQWRRHLPAALARAKQRLSHARVEGTDWYWPPVEDPAIFVSDERVRLLAPFDPVAWDRRRFALLWGWEYRFEAYTPVAKRKLGYYALPLLWRDEVIGWANAAAPEGEVVATFGYASGTRPRSRRFGSELALEIDRLRSFLAPAVSNTLSRPRLPRLPLRR
jgi:uncharacterized protein YcaQ